MDIIIKRSKIHGKGIFANKDFEKGEMVLKWNPTKLTLVEEENLTEEQKAYTISNKKGYYFMNSPEKFMNHSCEPNTTTDVDNFQDIAIKNIKKGEEITSSYLNEGKEKCNCGSKQCKGFI